MLFDCLKVCYLFQEFNDLSLRTCVSSRSGITQPMIPHIAYPWILVLVNHQAGYILNPEVTTAIDFRAKDLTGSGDNPPRVTPFRGLIYDT